MYKPGPVQTIIGFLIGAVLGFLINLGFIALFNQFCTWQGCALVEYTWCNLAGFPILVGTSMTLLLRNYPFRD